MVFEHDFKNFPELTNSQMSELYWLSPHKQITEDFVCMVSKVSDGDTIRVFWRERDFEFPIRMLGIDALELNEGGKDSKNWLKDKIEGKMITVEINRNQRVGKYGRLLGIIIQAGININEESIRTGQSVKFEKRNDGKIPNLNKTLDLTRWL